MNCYHLTIKSRNRKTGCIPVSTSPANTCPTTCPFRRSGCYAQGGPLSIHWAKVSSGKSGVKWLSFVDQIQSLPPNTLWRHNQCGDLRGSKNRINRTALNQLVQANQGRNGYTYTHYPMNTHNRQAIQHANQQGFTINISTESLTQADELLDLNIGPVVLTMPSNATNTRTPKGRRVIVCPAQTNDTITCDQCKLCARGDRKVVVGFRAHGCSKGTVDRMLNK